jgi:membrane protein implicated in regulation of membrane protease activity
MMMRNVLLVLGILATLMGLLWIGQGLGYIHWPASSFMLDQRPWADRGAALAVVGLLLILVARRVGRPRGR